MRTQRCTQRADSGMRYINVDDVYAGLPVPVEIIWCHGEVLAMVCQGEDLEKVGDVFVYNPIDFEHLDRVQRRLMAKESWFERDEFFAMPPHDRREFWRWLRIQAGEYVDLM